MFINKMFLWSSYLKHVDLCYFLQTELEGLTGLIRFNEAGHRRNFTLQVMEMTVDVDMVKVFILWQLSFSYFFSLIHYYYYLCSFIVLKVEK